VAFIPWLAQALKRQGAQKNPVSDKRDYTVSERPVPEQPCSAVAALLTVLWLAFSGLSAHIQNLMFGNTLLPPVHVRMPCITLHHELADVSNLPCTQAFSS